MKKAANKEDEKYITLNDAVLFDLIIMVFFVLLAIMSLDYNPRARSIPLALGIVGSVMMFLQFLVDALPRVRSKLRFVSQSGLLAGQNQFRPRGLVTPTEKVTAESDRISPYAQKGVQIKALSDWWRIFRVVLWLVGFMVLLAFTNYLIAVGTFVTLVIRLEGRESWRKSILLGISVDAGFYILFSVILQAQL